MRSLKGLSVAPGSSVPMPPGPVVVLVAPPCVVVVPFAPIVVWLPPTPPPPPVCAGLQADDDCPSLRLAPPSTRVRLRGAEPPMSAGCCPGIASSLCYLSSPPSSPLC